MRQSRSYEGTTCRNWKAVRNHGRVVGENPSGDHLIIANYWYLPLCTIVAKHPVGLKKQKLAFADAFIALTKLDDFSPILRGVYSLVQIKHALNIGDEITAPNHKMFQFAIYSATLTTTV